MFILVLMLESNILLMLMLMLMRSLFSAHCCYLMVHTADLSFVCVNLFFFVLYSKSLVLGFSCQEISITSPNDRCVHV